MLVEVDGLMELDGDTSPQTVPTNRRYRLTAPETVARKAVGELVTVEKVIRSVHAEAFALS